MISNRVLYPITAVLLVILAVLVGYEILPCLDRYKVRQHYKNEPQKLAAAEFLLDNMDKHGTTVGEGWKRYDTIFTEFEKHFEKHGYHSEKDPMTLQYFWDNVEKRNGPIADDGFMITYDTDATLSDILIDNIDAAFEAWQSVSDSLVTKDFRMFCEYVLPYRIGTEKPEKLRRHLLEEYRGMRDTLFTDINTIEKVMNKVLRQDGGYSNSELMWRFAYSIDEQDGENAPWLVHAHMRILRASAESAGHTGNHRRSIHMGQQIRRSLLGYGDERQHNGVRIRPTDGKEPAPDIQTNKNLQTHIQDTAYRR